MKKIFLILVLFFLVFLNINVYAEEYTCSYDFTYKTGIFDWVDNDENLIFTIDTTNKKITYPDDYFDKPIYFMDHYVSEKYTEQQIIESLNGGCVKNIVVGTIAFDTVWGYALFFEESHVHSLSEAPLGYALPTKFIEDEQVLGVITDVIYGTLNSEKSEGDAVDGNFPCEYYEDTIELLERLNCDDSNFNCSLSQIQEYNVAKENLKLFCKKIIEYGNVGLSRCLGLCLSLGKEPFFKVDFSNYDCGFSGKLILFIGNIIRWVKYIIPIVVIMLGILDFIKAIVADKEDEMKKAQQRFIKRLIAAALIFIIPVILEFVLNKMGFNAMGCGIINL